MDRQAKPAESIENDPGCVKTPEASGIAQQRNRTLCLTESILQKWYVARIENFAEAIR